MLVDLVIQELILQIENDLQYNEESRIFGNDGILDSMGLVNLIVALEERIQDEYDVVITLADERAMSRNKSPFRTVATFAEYIEELLHEEGVDV